MGVVMFIQSYTPSCAGDEVLICLASEENGYGAWCHDSIYFLADIKNNKRLNSNEN